MIARYLSAASVGLFVTAALLLLMQLLINTGAQVLVAKPARHKVQWIMQKPIEVVRKSEFRPTRLPPPARLPRSSPAERFETSPGMAVPLTEPAPPVTGTILKGPRVTDGPLMTVFKVRPNYPVLAAERGVEGFVTVQYDVLESGAVSNVTVVESSHRIFEKAAIAAAYRFRYRPRIVDGIAMPSFGLRNRFVFRLEDAAEH